MKKVIKASYAYEHPQYNQATSRYMPNRGEGDNMASQLVTAINRLVYKWYNDGDVYDNSYYLTGWVNDVSDAANWIYKYVPSSCSVLEMISNAATEADYDKILSKLVDTCMDMEDLEHLAKKPSVGSIYDCSGPFHFDENRYDEENDEDYDRY